MHELAAKALFEAQTNGFNEQLFRLRGWKLYKIEYPVIDIGFIMDSREDLRVKMQCDNWDEDPPSIQLQTMTGELLQHIKRDPTGILNDSRHPSTNFPFICMPGSREYHNHPSHRTNLWSNYKGENGYDLGGILTKIWRAWLKI